MPFPSLIAARLRSKYRPRLDYDMLEIPTDPEKTIRYVEFDCNCGSRLKAFVWLCADSAVSDIRYLSECPCQWQLSRKVQYLSLISSTPLQPDCIRTSVVYEEPEA